MDNNGSAEKKILIFSPYYSPHVGGVENYTEELCQKISQKNIQVVIFTPDIPKISEKQSRMKGIEIIRFPAFEIVPNYPLPKFWQAEFWRSYRKLFSLEFDVVISHTRFFSTTLLASHFSKKRKIKWIHIEHGSDFVQSGNFWVRLAARIYDQTLGKSIFKKADKLVAISASVRNFILELYPKGNPEVIYRGFDFEKIEKIQANLELAEKYRGKTIIVYIGRLISGKGVADLIKALNKVKSKNYQCLIIGNGPEKNNLLRLIGNYNLKKKITLLGHKEYEECIGVLKIADIFVNPSYTEGLPTTVVEVSACEKAIIASKVGGTEEIIENNVSGNLFKARDISGLAEKIEVLIEDESRRKNFGEKARKNVLGKFNWQKNIGKFLEIIK